MRYFGRYFANPRCEKPVKNWLLCVARENLRLKNSDIYTKIWLSAPKITKTRKLKTRFPSIVSICVHHGHKNKQKLTKTVCFSSLYIRDLNLPPIRFVQFVPQFIPRCRLYSFIISMPVTRCTFPCIHRSKKDGDMSILPECIAGIKKEYMGKDDKKQSYRIEILTQV